MIAAHVHHQADLADRRFVRAAGAVVAEVDGPVTGALFTLALLTSTAAFGAGWNRTEASLMMNVPTLAGTVAAVRVAAALPAVLRPGVSACSPAMLTTHNLVRSPIKFYDIVCIW